MKKSEQKMDLLIINEKSIFYKIKMFFKRLFLKNTVYTSDIITEKKDMSYNYKKAFEESIRVEETEEMSLLRLQRKYRDGIIKEEDLTKEQINSLSELYDKQIEELRRSNKLRKDKLLEYRRKMQSEN